MRIHTIGDSHSVYGWSDVITHHLGALLCYSYGKDPTRVPIQTFNIENGDSVIFCLGEIDCRCHVFKNSNENTSYQAVIDNIVENYFESIRTSLLEIRATYCANTQCASGETQGHKSSGLRPNMQCVSVADENDNVKLKYVGVYNVVPPVKKNTVDENSEYPYLGSDEERKQYVQYFNAKLEKYCALNGYIFFNVYDKYVDSSGFLNKELSDGNVHILNGKFISEFLRENFYCSS